MNTELVIRAVDCTSTSPTRFVTEASALGWRPGTFPQRVRTTLGSGHDFVRGTLSPACAVYYQLGGSKIELVVFND